MTIVPDNSRIQSKWTDFLGTQNWDSLAPGNRALIEFNKTHASYTNFSALSTKLKLTFFALGVILLVGGILTLTLGPKYAPHVNSTVFKAAGGLAIALGPIICLTAFRVIKHIKEAKSKEFLSSGVTKFQDELKKELHNFVANHKVPSHQIFWVGCHMDTQCFLTNGSEKKEELSCLVRDDFYLDALAFIKEIESKKSQV